jgi:predicted transposase/invertase (TIGR01784 family)
VTKDIPNPHDAFFKNSFAKPKLRADFCRCFLPEKLVAEIDVEGLRIQQGSFVDERLRQRHSDLLLRTVMKDGGDAWVYLLFEHQSTPHPDMPLRLWCYLARIWEQHREQQKRGGLLPLIDPVVLYHGKDAWTVPRCFSNSLNFPGDPGFKKPELEYIPIDLSGYSDEEIMERIWAKIGEALELRATLLLFKHIGDADFSKFFERLIPLLDELSERTTGLGYIETLLHYVYYTRSEEEYEEVQKLLDQAKPRVREIAMTTIAEHIHQEGVERGLQAARQMLLEELEDRFGPVAVTLKESLFEVKDPDVLMKLWRQSKKCESLEAFGELLEKNVQ